MESKITVKLITAAVQNHLSNLKGDGYLILASLEFSIKSKRFSKV